MPSTAAGPGYEPPYQPTPAQIRCVRPAAGAARQDPAVTFVSPTQEMDDEEESGGRLERLNWPGLAMAAVIGLLAIMLVVAYGIQGPGLLDRLVGGPNPPATPGEVSQVTGTPAGLPAVVLTPTVTATGKPPPQLLRRCPPYSHRDIGPDVDLHAGAAHGHAIAATDRDTDAATDRDADGAADANRYPDANRTLTPTVAPTVGPNPTMVACLAQVDPGLQGYLLQQDVPTLEAFGCPDGPALTGTAQSWPFERGYIVGFDMTQEMLVVYTETQAWERQFVPEGQEAPSEETPPEGLYIPTGRFGQLWRQGERRNELGFATAPAPGEFPAVFQTFPGALMILNQSSGQVVVLPTANQR